MARPVKWSRDRHAIRERAANSKTETWGRGDIERLFGVGRATAQTLMRAIGEIQPVGGAHFVERASLLAFLDAVIQAPTVEGGLRARLLEAEPPPKAKPLRLPLPAGLRSARLPDLPPGIRLTPGRIEIAAPTAEALLESLVGLALVLQNDLDSFREIVEPPAPPPVPDRDLQDLLAHLRQNSL